MAVGTRDRGVRSENKGAKQVSPRGVGLFRPREALADGEESLRRGVERVVEIFDVFVLPVRREGVLDEVVGSDAEEVRLLGQVIGGELRAGRLDHHADRDVVREGHALSRYCFCFPCMPRPESACTLIWRGFVSAFLGRKMRSTPSRLCAVTFSVSTFEGSVNLLAKLPYDRSTRGYPS